MFNIAALRLASHPFEMFLRRILHDRCPTVRRNGNLYMKLVQLPAVC